MTQSPLTLLAAAALLPAGVGFAHPSGHGDEADNHADTELHYVSTVVNGSAHDVQITERNGVRTITANGIPDHTPGRFPSRGNPNAISAQSYSFEMPLEPEKATREYRGRALFGVALNGVPFDPGTAEIWSPNGRTRGRDAPRDGWRYEAITGGINLGLDDHHAHVQSTGAYHYHGLPTGVYEAAAGKPTSKRPDQMIMVGYAADGFPIYGVWAHEDPMDPSSPLVKATTSHQTKDGSRPRKSDTSPGGKYDGTFVQDWEYVEGLGDLDQHHGRFGVTPEYPDGTYYYMITDEYPFIPRSFYGTPDPSFEKRGGGHGRVRGTGQGGRPERGERQRRF
ncbi:MAG: YHYH protein [Planctomycetota bacterium]